MLVKLLKDYEKTPIFNMIINLILVAYDARPATLLEFTSIRDTTEWDAMTLVIDSVISYLKLHKYQDRLSPNRFFVSKFPLNKLPSNDRQIGILLGFDCAGHEYDNMNVTRIIGDIYESTTGNSLYSEVCEERKTDQSVIISSLNKKVNKFDSVMIQLGLKYRFKYTTRKLNSMKIMMDPRSYTNHAFVEQNLEEYAMILTDMYYFDTSFVYTDNILDRFDLFVYIMNLCSDGTMDKLYENAPNGSPKYNQLTTVFKHLEQSKPHSDYQMILSTLKI